VRTENPYHDTLNIAAPYVEGHAYKAGPWHSHWMSEKHDLSTNPLVLRNAHGDRKQAHDSKKIGHHPRAIPEKNTDLLMSCGPEYPALSSPQVQITAPIPLTILSGAAETTQYATITFTPPNGGNPTTRPAPPHAAVITILLYKWHGERPCLVDESSGCSWETGGHSDDFQSINIYASSKVDEDCPQHAKDAFAAAAKLLGETAYIDWPNGTAFHRLPATPPAGLKWPQVNLFFSDVLKLTDEHSPLLDADFVDLRTEKLPFAWEPDRGGQSTNCGQITGDDDGGDND
jgi:hypothetical protein